MSPNTIPVNLAADKLYVEAVEKVDLDRIWQIAGKCDLLECSVYDDLMLGRD